ncbi:MAG: hypothetical protein HDT22_11755 [Ruminococcus sp.]|nr:hypothetical protein [Ruminococcus sp.]
MRKKLILFMGLGILCCCCSSCGIITELALAGYELTKDNTSETKISYEEEQFENYVEEQFAEKYGKEFELLDFKWGLMAAVKNCNMKCLDDGIEFQAHVSVDTNQVEEENYLLQKYFDDVQNDVIDYVNQYFDGYKLVKMMGISKYLPFETSSNLSYEELKKLGHFTTKFYILIPEDTVFSDEEWSMITEKIASSNEYTEDDDKRSPYKEDINLKIDFSVYCLPNDVYHDLEFVINIIEFRKLLEENTDCDCEITRML